VVSLVIPGYWLVNRKKKKLLWRLSGCSTQPPHPRNLKNRRRLASMEKFQVQQQIIKPDSYYCSSFNRLYLLREPRHRDGLSRHLERRLWRPRSGCNKAKATSRPALREKWDSSQCRALATSNSSSCWRLWLHSALHAT